MNKIFLSFFFLIFISSCVTKKVDVVDLSVPPKNAKELIEKVHYMNNQPEWLSLRGKVNLKVEDEKNFTLNIAIKVRKDSVIWASVSAPFGIELFRTMLTNDSVYYINRTNKTYFVKPITHVAKVLKTAITFDEIQEIITANPRILKQKYLLKASEQEYNLVSLDFVYTISNLYRITSATLFDGKNSLAYSYSNFNPVNNFPKQLELSVKTPSQNTFQVKMDYSKVVFNQKQKLPFKIPNSYVEKE
ncbi:MAG: DUF4292 domain-containing protein [Flavobacteriales bacterium]|nr:DUF4292 domain-containing protein [Flavobacteriales bacterium]